MNRAPYCVLAEPEPQAQAANPMPVWLRTEIVFTLYTTTLERLKTVTSVRSRLTVCFTAEFQHLPSHISFDSYLLLLRVSESNTFSH